MGEGVNLGKGLCEPCSPPATHNEHCFASQCAKFRFMADEILPSIASKRKQHHAKRTEKFTQESHAQSKAQHI